MAKKASVAEEERPLSWIDAGGGYMLALEGEKLVCRNARGQRLATVPKDVKEGPVAAQLQDTLEWLERHAKECRETVETWMLRSLPTPRAVLAGVWADPSWRAALENAVVAPVDAEGRTDLDSAGFLKAVDPAKGLGIINLDGETVWLDSPAVAIPHPILLPERESFLELAGDLELKQGLSQLFRETFPREVKKENEDDTSLSRFSGGSFDQLNFVLGLCRKLGYRVRGGYATQRMWEAGQVVEARFWIGSESPEWETETGELMWVDAREHSLPLSQVGRVAWSEGLRMASSIYAARKVEKEENDG